MFVIEVANGGKWPVEIKPLQESDFLKLIKNSFRINKCYRGKLKSQ